MRPDITIGVPAYRGQETIAETLRSIRDQTYPHYQVLISIDGGDSDADETARACEPFLADPRVRLQRQPRRLGWKGNLNTLMRQADTPYFCYWQQDDLAATNYLAALREAHAQEADLSVSYADVQWFGSRYDRTALDSITGSPLERVLQIVETIHFAPLRGLIRTACLPPGDAIRDWPEDFHAETVFLAELARAGTMRRVPDTLYFKRAHAASAHFDALQHLPAFLRRRAWISMGAGLVDVARRCAGPLDADALTAIVVDRLCIPRPGRGFFVIDESPGAVRRFVRDFVAATELWSGKPLDAALQTKRWPQWPVHEDVVAGFADAFQRASQRHSLLHRLRDGERVLLAAGASPDLSICLGDGWSHEEPWGVWSDGDRATVLLPPGVGCLQFRGVLHGVPGQQMVLTWRVDDSPIYTCTAKAMVPLAISWEKGNVASCPQRLLLVISGVASPASLGHSADERVLGLGMHSLALWS